MTHCRYDNLFETVEMEDGSIRYFPKKLEEKPDPPYIYDLGDDESISDETLENVMYLRFCGVVYKRC